MGRTLLTSTLLGVGLLSMALPGSDLFGMALLGTDELCAQPALPVTNPITNLPP